MEREGEMQKEIERETAMVDRDREATSKSNEGI